MAAKNMSVPLKLLHEGEGHSVTIELKNGEIYRGLLQDSEECMNCQLSSVTMTARDGRVSKLELVYLRGSQIKLFILPDLLKNAPMFKKIQEMKTPRERKTTKKNGTHQNTASKKP